MERLLKKKSTIVLFLLPGVLFFSIVVAFPLFYTIVLSLFNWGLMGPARFLGIRNYIQLFGLDSTFQQALKNTLLLTLGCVCTQTPLAVFFAFLLRRPFPGKGFYKTAFFIPHMISSVASALLWYFILHPDFGIVNSLLRMVGLGDLARAWIGDPATILGWVVTAMAWQHFGYHMIIYLAAMQGIADDILDAAVIDGTNSWQNFWHIVFPLITPIMKVDIILIATGSLRAFDMIYAMTGGGPNHATEVISTMLYFRSFQGMQFGYGSAMAVILIVFCLAATGIINKAFKGIEDKVV